LEGNILRQGGNGEGGPTNTGGPGKGEGNRDLRQRWESEKGEDCRKRLFQTPDKYKKTRFYAEKNRKRAWVKGGANCGTKVKKKEETGIKGQGAPRKVCTRTSAKKQKKEGGYR